MIHGHGNDGYRLGRPLRGDFSSNVPPGGAAADLRLHLTTGLDRLGSYPEAAAESFVAAVADSAGVPSAHVGATNGSVAAIYQLAQVWRGRRSAVVVPAFAEYEDACRLHAHEIAFATTDLQNLAALAGLDVVWLANPNNPTGEVLPREALLARVDSHRGTTFVVDLAYADLCAEEPLRPSDVVVRANLVLLLSFTKRFAIPGLRLGAVIGPAPLVAATVQHGGPWAVNTLAAAAGRFLLGPRANVEAPRRAAAVAESQRLQAALRALAGLTVRPSPTNYFLLRTERGSGAQLREYLACEHGLLVRDAANFRGLDRQTVRIAAQTPRENAWLEEALAQWTRRS